MSVQALAKMYFEVENRSYDAGVVVTFSSDSVGGWVVSKGWADSTPSVVAAAIAAGAVQKNHSAGFPARRRPAEVQDDPDTGRPVLTGSAVEAVQSLIAQHPDGYMCTDSQGQRLIQPPTSTYGSTFNKGTYINGSGVLCCPGNNPGGVMKVYATNPARLEFRFPHNLVTGDEATAFGIPATAGVPHQLNGKLYTLIKLDDTNVALAGVDATSYAEWTSAGAGTDASLVVDQVWGSDSLLSFLLLEAGNPFSKFDYDMVSGRTTRQLADAAIAKAKRMAASGLRVPLSIAMHGHNDGSNANIQAVTELRDALLSFSDYVLAIPAWAQTGWADPGSLPTAACFDAYADFWAKSGAANPRVLPCDMRGVLSDPRKPLEASASVFFAGDGTHLIANGGLPCGRKGAKPLRRIWTKLRRMLASFKFSNLLTGARYSGASTANLPAGFTGEVATGFTLAKTANVNAGFCQVLRFPAYERVSGTTPEAGDVLSINGRWFAVKVSGQLAAAVPDVYTTHTGVTAAGANPVAVTSSATSKLFGWATPITDGAAQLYEIPAFIPQTDDNDEAEDYVQFQYISATLSSETTNDFISLYQTVALPNNVAVGDHVQGEWLVSVAGGFAKAVTAMTTLHSASSALQTNQLARAQGISPSTLLTRRPVLDIRPKNYKTPQLRVCEGTTHIDHRMKIIFGIDGLNTFIALPKVAKV